MKQQDQQRNNAQQNKSGKEQTSNPSTDYRRDGVQLGETSQTSDQQPSGVERQGGGGSGYDVNREQQEVNRQQEQMHQERDLDQLQVEKHQTPLQPETNPGKQQPGINPGTNAMG